MGWGAVTPAAPCLAGHVTLVHLLCAAVIDSSAIEDIHADGHIIAATDCPNTYSYQARRSLAVSIRTSGLGLRLCTSKAKMRGNTSTVANTILASLKHWVNLQYNTSSILGCTLLHYHGIRSYTYEVMGCYLFVFARVDQQPYREGVVASIFARPCIERTVHVLFDMLSDLAL